MARLVVDLPISCRKLTELLWAHLWSFWPWREVMGKFTICCLGHKKSQIRF